ncbi:MAG: hypothetical protein Q9227_000612 [Pyrenula ochraceoflavens]
MAADRARLKMKGIFGQLGRSGSLRDRERSGSDVPPRDDSPQAVIAREAVAFCEAGGPNAAANAVLASLENHLCRILISESSPAAAAEAATRIRKFMGKDNYMRAYAQYNAIMLMRILADNPGRSFTKNFDAKFISTIKDLLRDGRDMSVQQILRETMDNFETEKLASNETLEPLVEMWKKEKVKIDKRGNGPPGLRVLNAPAYGQEHHSRRHRHRGLPPPGELAARIEEAKTTAKLLIQTVQSTPSTDIENNELIREFAGRAQAASRSIQEMIHSTDPSPDEDTLLTLIETNDLLSMAMSKQQRAILQARRSRSTSPNAALQQQQQQTQQALYAPSTSPTLGTISTTGSQIGSESPPRPGLHPRTSVSQASVSPYSEEDNNPFADRAAQQQSYSLFDSYRASPLPRTTPPPPSQPAPLQPAPLSPKRKPLAPQTDSQRSLGRQDSEGNNPMMYRTSPKPPVELPGEDRGISGNAFAQRQATNTVGR